ncbi:GntR family transcriptional regulator [Enterobacter cancerogenus]|uniref:GntR family transcriptional regulator n=1 Tax=Enterobacter cancerogenus TaxID=69218 RepID=A0A484ZB59_9ENTR|nr:GntR family transcriptional regulator [Enterobacter cancerogenus]
MLSPPVLGWYPLREAIARYLNISRGLACTPEQVLITSGYSGSLRLILDTLASRSDKVVFEDPGYFMGQQLLKRIVPRLHTVPVDRAGMDIDYLLRNHRACAFCPRYALASKPAGGNSLFAAQTAAAGLGEPERSLDH